MRQFKDRNEAGRLLALKLMPFEHYHPIILALPRGGVPLAYEIAQKLNTDLDVVLVKKIHAPGSPEFAIGAIGEDEVPFLHEDYIEREDLDREEIERIIEKRIDENRKRQTLYREKIPAMNLTGRTVILVDDGLATGASMMAALKWVKTKNVKRIIVAVPVSSTSGAQEIKEEADEFISLITSENMLAVGYWYQDFAQVNDSEVLDYLEKRPRKVNVTLKSSTVESEIKKHAVKFEVVDDLRSKLIKEMSKHKIVMLGEATHGTREFYQLRREISKILMQDFGFSFVAVEGDWPDCFKLTEYINSNEKGKKEVEVRKIVHDSYHRWPTWMWANEEIPPLIEWMKTNHIGSFYGLDVYSMFDSLNEVKKYMNRIDPELAADIERSYHCFDQYYGNEMKYAESLLRAPAGCKEEVISNLRNILRMRLKDTKLSKKELFDMKQNAEVIRNAENYYRTMLSGGAESWNVRDIHMMETLENLLRLHGDDAKAIVWAHNTHIGDYHATDMLEEGYVNLGGLARERFGSDQVYLLGFGSYKGSVRAGKAWGRKDEEMTLPAAKPGSYEDHFHNVCIENQAAQIFVTLNKLHKSSLLNQRSGHRAVGVVYDPIHERHGHNYVPTRLAQRYDGFIFVDETHALASLESAFVYGEIPETWPGGI